MRKIACTGASGGTCAHASGSGNTVNETVDLPAGATATYTIHGTIDPGAAGALANTTTVVPPAGIADLVPGNNSSTANISRNSSNRSQFATT